MGRAYTAAKKAQTEQGQLYTTKDTVSKKKIYHEPQTALDGQPLETYVISSTDEKGNIVARRESLTPQEVSDIQKTYEATGQNFSLAKVPQPDSSEPVQTSQPDKIKKSLAQAIPQQKVSAIDSTPPVAVLPGALDPNSDLILSLRGTFFWVRLSDTVSPGMYAIEELNNFMGATGPARDYYGPDNPILLTNVDIIQSDITSEVPCLNNIKVFYTFGQNFGQVQISGEMLLGPMGAEEQHQRGFKLLRDFFYDYRVSRYKRPISVSVCKEPFFVFLKGLRVGQVDPNFHVMPFVMFGTLLDISREDALNLNPATKVVTAASAGQSSLEAALRASRPADLVVVVETAASVAQGKGADPSDVIPDGNVVKLTKPTSANMVIAAKAANGKSYTPDEVLYRDLRTVGNANEIDHKSKIAHLNETTTGVEREDYLDFEDSRYNKVKSSNDKMKAVLEERILAEALKPEPAYTTAEEKLKLDQERKLQEEKDKEIRRALLNENEDFLRSVKIDPKNKNYIDTPSADYVPYNAWPTAARSGNVWTTTPSGGRMPEPKGPVTQHTLSKFLIAPIPMNSGTNYNPTP